MNSIGLEQEGNWAGGTEKSGREESGDSGRGVCRDWDAKKALGLSVAISSEPTQVPEARPMWETRGGCLAPMFPV
jgi:hypothetical protein